MRIELNELTRNAEEILELLRPSAADIRREKRKIKLEMLELEKRIEFLERFA